MGFLRSLLWSESNETAKTARVRVHITYTEEELEAIQNYSDEINSFAPEPGQVFYASNEMVNPIRALALVEHVVKQMVAARGLTEEKNRPFVDKLIKTVAKASAMHELPFYFYLWAGLSAVKGDKETAKRLYALFLKFQAEFKPGKVDNFIIGLLKLHHWFDVENAMSLAQQSIARS